MFGKKFIGRTPLLHNKNTKDIPAERFIPNEILLPMIQHIGAPATPIVAVGDTVKIGDKIAEASGAVSSPIYSGISGKVIKIENYLRPNGKTVPAVRILSDGLMEKKELVPPTVTNLDELILAVKESGIVGLGGAGFPTAVKLAGAKGGNIHTLIINAAECEPYITSDTRTMLEKPGTLKSGISLITSLIPSVERVYIGIEKNKPECISLLRETFADNSKVEVYPLPSRYPQGAEKVIIYNTTGVVVEEGKLPADFGILVMNVTTLVSVMEYIETGMPLVERSFTVDGSAVESPKNVTAPIGTSISDVLSFVGVDEEKIGKVLYGGPMMGVAVCSLTEPIIKTTNALTVITERDVKRREPTACIHCGACVAACPINLNPTAFAHSLSINVMEDRVARLEEDKVKLCMECGCCSYVCPAGRPLVQNNRIAKAEIAEFASHRAKLK